MTLIFCEIVSFGAGVAVAILLIGTVVRVLVLGYAKKRLG